MRSSNLPSRCTLGADPATYRNQMKVANAVKNVITHNGSSSHGITNQVRWKAALAANTRERRNGQRVVDYGGKGRVATDIASYSTGIYRLENQHDVVIEPRLHSSNL